MTQEQNINNSEVITVAPQKKKKKKIASLDRKKARAGWFFVLPFLIGFIIILPIFYWAPEAAASNRCVSNSLHVMLNMWKNFCMMMMIVSGVTLLYYKTAAKNWLIKIAPYGKMSLTNYLGQSIIGGIIFYNWGFGLFDNCGHTASFIMGAALIVLQYLFCNWWLKSHKRGPFEELWNQATWFGKH